MREYSKAQKYKHFIAGYLLNPDGEVFSTKSGMKIKQYPNNAGYMRFQVYIQGKKKWYFTHITVVNLFGDRKGQRMLPDKTLSEMGWSIDHIDGNKLNNSRKNLQIVTHKENINRYYEKKRGSKYARK